MLQGYKIVVVMPAYNAEQTLEMTYAEIPHDIVDAVILVDDGSHDATAEVARDLGLQTIVHPENRGYGGNQKTCYAAALEIGADIVIMVHPDYQYTPKLIRAMASLISEGLYDVVLGSRILGKGAREGGMPKYKYFGNRFLTLVENLLIDQKLSEYHTGYRAFRREVLTDLRLDLNGDDFVFDNQMLVQCYGAGFRVAEVTTPTKYTPAASSISFRRSLTYGFGCLGVGFRYFLHRKGWKRFKQFEARRSSAPSSVERGETAPATHHDPT